MVDLGNTEVAKISKGPESTGAGPTGEVPATQAWELSLDPQHPIKRAGYNMGAHL